MTKQLGTVGLALFLLVTAAATAAAHSLGDLESELGL